MLLGKDIPAKEKFPLGKILRPRSSIMCSADSGLGILDSNLRVIHELTRGRPSTT